MGHAVRWRRNSQRKILNAPRVSIRLTANDGLNIVYYDTHVRIAAVATMTQPETLTTQTLTADDKDLVVVTLAVRSKSARPRIPARLKDIWGELSKFTTQQTVVLFMRDTEYSDQIAEKYPDAWVRGNREIQVGLPSWEMLDGAALDHACTYGLYTLAREQSVTFPSRLGERLVAEGCAWQYAAHRTGWHAPWLAGEVPDDVRATAFREWGNEPIPDEWTERGNTGKQLLGSLGYAIVGKEYPQFDLEHSMTAPVDLFRKHVLG